MATLEKIRNKSVLLFVVIIVALLAFILGDFLTSGRTYFGSPTTVAKAGDATVEYQDYQARLATLNERANGQGRNYDGDMMSQQAINELLMEKLFQQEYEDLGIVVTDKEITEAMTGENIHPQAGQTIAYLSQQLGLPEASGAAVFDAMMQPAKYGLSAEAGEQLKTIWSSQEKDIENALLSEKFYRLVSGLFTANKLDAKALYDDNAATRHIAYAMKETSTMPDDAVEFSDKDVEALWKSRKNEYALDEEMRAVDYIYVSIEPSEADRMAAEKKVEAALEGLNTRPGTEGVAQDPGFVVTPNVNTLGNIRDAKLKEFIEKSEAGKAELLSRVGNTYKIAKLNETKSGIDSISVSVIRADEVATLDSIANVLNTKAAKFEDVVDNQTIFGQDSTWISLEGVGMDEKIKNALASAAIGNAFVLTDSIQGQVVGQLFRVNERHAPVTFYDFATIEYVVDPSYETLTDLSTKLRTYISNNSSAADFSANAADAGYSILSAQVGPSSVRIGTANDSRKFIKWVMEADKGKVSPLLQDDKQTYLLALAVTDIYEDYMPWTSASINAQLSSEALNAKKAAKLMEDYSGKATDLAGYAKEMGVEVSEGDVVFNSPMFLNRGINESELQGAVAAAEEGKLVGPVKGGRGILVFEVKGTNTESRPFIEDEYTSRFNQTFGLGRMNPMSLLLGKEKVDNRSLNFVQSIGE